MLSQIDVQEYGRIIDALQAQADVQSLEGQAELASLLVRSRQALRACMTKAMDLQRLAQETDAILSPPRANGADTH